MNYLAHLHLSDETPGAMIGNVAADFLKGREWLELPEDVRLGVEEHRRVDSFTDNHPVFRRSVQRLFPRWGRYSPILVDMVYDHLLTVDWNRFGRLPLRPFLDGRYEAMLPRVKDLDDKVRKPLLRMIETDFLSCYGELENMSIALDKISRRFKRKPVNLVPAVEDFRRMHGPLREDFREFFPQLAAHVIHTRANGNPGT